jgi:ABC-type transporter Mla subunit MlaD
MTVLVVLVLVYLVTVVGVSVALVVAWLLAMFRGRHEEATVYYVVFVPEEPDGSGLN